MGRLSLLALAAILWVAGPSAPTSEGRSPWFINPARLQLAALIPSPPAANSAAASEDLAEVHRLEQMRTPAEIAAAQYDDQHEDIFIFATVLGSDFNAQKLPLTSALSQHLRNDASLVDNPIKKLYRRPRPYNFDPTLHPVCETNQEWSYPSGHSLNGYLYAFALVEIVPEKHDLILRRADQYAHNRLVCGSHYATDTAASRQLASFLFGYLLNSPRFQTELAVAAGETRTHLGLTQRSVTTQ